MEAVDKIIKEPRWNKPLDRGEYFYFIPDLPRSYPEVLAGHLHRFVETTKNAMFAKVPAFKGSGFGQIFGETGWLTHFYGNIGDENHEQFVEKIIQETKQRAETAKKQSSQPVSPQPTAALQQPKGYGSHFFPPIVIGKISKPTPSEILYGGQPYISPFSNKVFDTKFQKIPIAATKDGFIIVFHDKIETALKILNTIMATAALEGIQAFAIRDHELSEVTYNPETFAMTGFTYNIKTVRDLLFQEQYGEKIRLDYRRREIAPEQLKKIIDDASKIFENQTIAEELRILLESITHLNDSEFAQAFFMGWVIIERHISQIWYEKIHVRKILDHNRISKLLNPGQWSIDYLIEVLNMEGDIEEHEYDVYMDLKRKRNDLIHFGKQIRKDDAEKCVDVAKSIMLKKIAKILTGTRLS